MKFINPFSLMWLFLERRLSIPRVKVINFIAQRIFGINGNIAWSVHFTSRVSGNVRIGKGVEVSMANSLGCYIQGINGVEIGDGTIFAPGVKIISANHDVHDYSKWIKCRPIVIGKSCWIGANAVILPGVNLGDRVVVGAGSVVTHDIPTGCIAVGVPAKILKTRV